MRRIRSRNLIILLLLLLRKEARDDDMRWYVTASICAAAAATAAASVSVGVREHNNNCNYHLWNRLYHRKRPPSVTTTTNTEEEEDFITSSTAVVRQAVRYPTSRLQKQQPILRHLLRFVRRQQQPRQQPESSLALLCSLKEATMARYSDILNNSTQSTNDDAINFDTTTTKQWNRKHPNTRNKQLESSVIEEQSRPLVSFLTTLGQFLLGTKPRSNAASDNNRQWYPRKNNRHHHDDNMRANIYDDDDDDDNEDDDVDVKIRNGYGGELSSTPTTGITSIVAVITNWFRIILNDDDTNHEILRILRRGLQYGIVLYLLMDIGKLLVSTIDTINQSLLEQLNRFHSDQPHDDDTDTDNNQQQPLSTAAYRNHKRQIQEIVQQLHQQQQRVATPNLNNDNDDDDFQPQLRSSDGSTTSINPVVYQSIVATAQLLHSAGIPYMDETAAATTADSNGNMLDDDSTVTQITTVESLLLSLTLTEIGLLHQCLYIVPQPDDVNDNDDYHQRLDPSCTSSSRGSSTSKNQTKHTDHGLKYNNNNSVRRNLIGLESIHEHIVDTIQTSLGRNIPSGNDASSTNSNTNTASAASNPFFSLFHDVASTTSNKSNKNVGILLYGPPGCGKTNLIRTLVRTLRLPCIVVTPSILLRKYVGETNLHIRIIFHMIQSKLSPCIMCIDELDGLFRERQQEDEHEVSRGLKTEFLQWMDGMMTTSTTGATTTTDKSKRRKNPMIIIGATNRPFDVDAAILRRLSHTYYIGLPNSRQRHNLFLQFLQPIPNTILSKNQVAEIVSITAGYTPSDLRQLLQVAAISGPMKRQGTTTDTSVALTIEDVFNAMAVIGPTPLSSKYEQQMRQFRSHRNPVNVDRFGNAKDRHSLYMNDDDSDVFGKGKRSDRPFSLAFMDRKDPENYYYSDDDDDDDGDDGGNDNDWWETVLGNYYNLGTIEIDQSTLDLFVQYIDKVLQERDDNDSEGDDSNNF